MALHIRDFRQSDAAELTQLSESAHVLGALPSPEAGARILIGLRGHRLTGAIWFTLKGQTGIISCIAVAQANGWHSDVQELIVEASLWLSSRGAAHIDLMTIPGDEALIASLMELNFRTDERTGVMRRLLPAQSAA
ncbi:MAG: hypothetical protein FP825_02075 [Hyphomonas sp.]|jgi:hypothetical protein|uniref:hypothetical protein n=1 Tax=Hyphomonas sp. TaxID=87 RepID=UPI0017B8AF2E|nr:hypothetical protein [Hyphomonas sp.]MBA3067252.1 hypothetical protein [Hyphomonas sp.]MBU4061474.1 hypothetical protein [Alphaproteobacteria bacterium]MBU4163216.1 hypothetical protein [Alphaproteobacteria bacterium]MDP3457652.1 hypothetical protein [Hyphomonas sp.]